MTAYFSTGKRFYGCNNRESNVKSYENLDTNGGNISIFQCKKPPNSRKDNTNANVLRVMKHIGTTKFNEKIKGSQNHEISYYCRVFQTARKFQFWTIPREILANTPRI